jgi:hypothetical protein
MAANHAVAVDAGCLEGRRDRVIASITRLLRAVDRRRHADLDDDLGSKRCADRADGHRP